MTRSVLGATAATESSRQRERKPLSTTLHESNCHIVPNAPVSTPESRKSLLDFYERVNAKATAALRCDGPALILQGEPTLAIEAAAASLIGRDDVVLTLSPVSTARASAPGPG